VAGNAMKCLNINSTRRGSAGRDGLGYAGWYGQEGGVRSLKPVLAHRDVLLEISLSHRAASCLRFSFCGRCGSWPEEQNAELAFSLGFRF